MKALQSQCQHGQRPCRLQRRCLVVCQVDAQKRVVILGGTGRVGSATAASLLAHYDNYDITVGGRKRESYEQICKLRPSLQKARFVECDISDPASVKVSTWRIPGWRGFDTHA